MNIYIVIPAHNEEKFINKTLESLTQQTLLPKKLVVIADNCTDNTLKIAQQYAGQFAYIEVISNLSSEQHEPGSKIIKAFNKGLEVLDNNYDVICKFDADLIFPRNYLETIANHFENNATIGLCGGFCYTLQNNTWTLENLTNKEHLRGALKAYRKACFEQIGGLQPSIGWDTVDELLAQYQGWIVKTDTELKVKHLRPTGNIYNASSKQLQGEAMYKMRYGITLTLISALKFAITRKQCALVKDYFNGYFKAKKQNLIPLVTAEQGKFIRRLRWRGILKKIRA